MHSTFSTLLAIRQWTSKVGIVIEQTDIFTHTHTHSCIRPASSPAKRRRYQKAYLQVTRGGGGGVRGKRRRGQRVNRRTCGSRFLDIHPCNRANVVSLVCVCPCSTFPVNAPISKVKFACHTHSHICVHTYVTYAHNTRHNFCIFFKPKH